MSHVKKLICKLGWHTPDVKRMDHDKSGRATSYCVRCNEHLTQRSYFDEDY